MKHILASLLLVIATGAFAQGAKPTRDQTVEYIKANYRTAIDYGTREETQDANTFLARHLEGKIRDIKFYVAGTRVNFSFIETLHLSQIGGVKTDDGPVRLDEEKDLTNDIVLISFDLKDIESIDGVTADYVHDIQYDKAESGSRFPMYLRFTAANKKPLIRYENNGEVKQYADVWVPYST